MFTRSMFKVNIYCLLLLVALVSAGDSGIKTLKFCPNLNQLYLEVDMLERWSHAKQSGFHAVEATYLYDYPLEEVVQAKEAAGVDHIFINVYRKNPDEQGYAALPDKREQFEDSLQRAITYCKALKCKVIHILAGNVPNPTEDNDRAYEENLRSAAINLEKENIVGVIQVFNKISLPTYYLTSVTKALDIVKRINSPYIKLLADIFHWKMSGVDLTQSITEAFPYIGHIQAVQAPDKHEPDTCGTIDFRSVFALLESLEYKGWIGLEYIPLSGTEAGLTWINEMGYSL